MRMIYERYWQLASYYDKKQKDAENLMARSRFHPKKLNKFDDEHQLADRLISAIDSYIEEQAKIKETEHQKA